MKFTEKTIKRLAEIGFNRTNVKRQYVNNEHTVWIDLSSRASVSISIFDFFTGANADCDSLRVRAMNAITVAEQAEKIIKENGK